MMRLKELRKENSKTQEEVAKQLSITQTTYGRYETEIITPPIDTLSRLADYYNVSLDYLVGREFANDIGYLTEDEKLLLNIYRTLNKNNKIRIVAEAQGMAIAQD